MGWMMRLKGTVCVFGVGVEASLIVMLMYVLRLGLVVEWR
jgi:hypothetical protein